MERDIFYTRGGEKPEEQSCALELHLIPEEGDMTIVTQDQVAAEVKKYAQPVNVTMTSHSSLFSNLFQANSSRYM